MEETVKYYKKELVSNRLAMPNGRAVIFEQVGGTDTGVLAAADLGLIAELDKAVAAEIGGLTHITEPQYQDLKKNPPVGRSRIRSLDAQSLRQLISSQKPAGPAQAAVINREPSAPMEVPKGIATISSRKKLRELTEKAAASRIGQGMTEAPAP